jgi:hypothetical protein
MFQRIGSQGFPRIRSGVGTNILANLADKGVVKDEGMDRSISGYVLPYVVEALSSKNLFLYVVMASCVRENTLEGCAPEESRHVDERESLIKAL